nr:choline/ethanolaminephosphotransferase 1 [Ipomoea batatas]
MVSMVNVMPYRFYILVFVSLKHWPLAALLCVDLLLSGSGLYQLLHSTVQPGSKISTVRAVLLLMIVFGVIPTVSFNVQNVYKVVTAKKGSMLLALAMLYPFVVLLGGVLLWEYISPYGLMGNYPHLFIVGTGLAFGFLVSLLYLPFAIANALTARLNDGIPLVDEFWILLGFCVYSVSLYLHFATSVIHEITAALGISCFSMGMVLYAESAIAFHAIALELGIMKMGL